MSRWVLFFLIRPFRSFHRSPLAVCTKYNIDEGEFEVIYLGGRFIVVDYGGKYRLREQLQTNAWCPGKGRAEIIGFYCGTKNTCSGGWAFSHSQPAKRQ